MTNTHKTQQNENKSIGRLGLVLNETPNHSGWEDESFVLNPPSHQITPEPNLARPNGYYSLPDDWQSDVFSWLSDHRGTALENVGDQGGWPDDDLEAAFDALGYLSLHTTAPR